jgi:hypothetical protein
MRNFEIVGKPNGILTYCTDARVADLRDRPSEVASLMAFMAQPDEESVVPACRAQS